MSNMYYQAIKISLRNLWSYKVRSLLTILGMVIGITAVIVIFSSGGGLKVLLHQQIDQFGSDLIEVEVKTPATAQISAANVASQAMGATITTLKLADMEAAKKLSNVADGYAAIMAQEQVTYQNETKRAIVFAVSSSAQDIDRTKVAVGRFFSSEEDEGLARVVVLGSEMKKILFGDLEPIGKYVKIRQMNFRVIGVMEPRGSYTFMNMDEIVYIPVQTAQKLLLGIDHIVMFMVKVRDGKLAGQTVADLQQMMKQRHNAFTADKEDFAVISMEQAKAIMDTVFNYLTFLLIALAAISLLVGGVGIMNVMFVSVRERTYEIGLRKAVGATNKSILWQFLIETAIVALVAGIIGIIFGVLLSLLMSWAATSAGFAWPFVLPIWGVLTATIFSIAFGFIFGILPARTASKLDPIVALRYE